jgi:hypothetical protein
LATWKLIIYILTLLAATMMSWKVDVLSWAALQPHLFRRERMRAPRVGQAFGPHPMALVDDESWSCRMRWSGVHPPQHPTQSLFFSPTLYLIHASARMYRLLTISSSRCVSSTPPRSRLRSSSAKSVMASLITPFSHTLGVQTRCPIGIMSTGQAFHGRAGQKYETPASSPMRRGSSICGSIRACGR